MKNNRALKHLELAVEHVDGLVQIVAEALGSLLLDQRVRVLALRQRYHSWLEAVRQQHVSAAERRF